MRGPRGALLDVGVAALEQRLQAVGGGGGAGHAPGMIWRVRRQLGLAGPGGGGGVARDLGIQAEHVGELLVDARHGDGIVGVVGRARLLDAGQPAARLVQRGVEQGGEVLAERHQLRLRRLGLAGRLRGVRLGGGDRLSGCALGRFRHRANMARRGA